MSRVQKHVEDLEEVLEELLDYAVEKGVSKREQCCLP